MATVYHETEGYRPDRITVTRATDGVRETIPAEIVITAAHVPLRRGHGVPPMARAYLWVEGGRSLYVLEEIGDVLDAIDGARLAGGAPPNDN